MNGRFYFSLATVIAAGSLAIGAIVSPGNMTGSVAPPPVEDSVITQPQPQEPQPGYEGDPDTLLNVCVGVNNLLNASLGPALDSLEDTPESRNEVAAVLRQHIPDFEAFADELEAVNDPVYLLFSDMAYTSADLADALESGRGAEETTAEFDAFNQAGTAMSDICFSVYQQTAPQ